MTPIKTVLLAWFHQRTVFDNVAALRLQTHSRHCENASYYSSSDGGGNGFVWSKAQAQQQIMAVQSSLLR